MKEIVATYLYLWFSLLLLTISLFLLWLNRKQRKEILLSAALSAPFGFLSVFFVPDYWDPVRVVEFGAGFEDLIFSFAGGGIVWFSVCACCRLYRHRQINHGRVIVTCLLTTAIGLSLAKILHLAGFPPMTITCIGFLAAVIIFLLLRFDLWRLSAAGAVCYGSVYTLFCLVFFWVEPDFLEQWNLEALSGYYFAGVPVEEIAWSIGFGAVWSLILGFGLDVRISKGRGVSGEEGAGSPRLFGGE